MVRIGLAFAAVVIGFCFMVLHKKHRKLFLWAAHASFLHSRSFVDAKRLVERLVRVRRDLTEFRSAKDDWRSAREIATAIGLQAHLDKMTTVSVVQSDNKTIVEMPIREALPIIGLKE